MRIISTCLVLLLSGFGFSQFNRTFLHSHWSGGFNFLNYSFYDNQNKVNLISTGTVGSNVAKIITERISATGDLEDFQQYDYAVNFPTTGQNSLLLTTIDHGTERDYVLSSGTSGFMYLIWIKTDKATGALLNTITSTSTYKGAYFEPKLVGNELVTYAVKSSGDLVRIALNATTFAAPSEELVDASVDNAGSFPNVINFGFKSGNLFVVNGQEKVVWGVGVSSAIIYTRTAPGVFASVNTGVPTTRSVSSFLVDPTTIGVTNGVNVEHYNASGTMVASGNLPGPANSNVSQIEFADNRYHAYYRYSGSSRGIFFSVDPAFQILDSTTTTLSIYHISKGTNGLLLTGSDAQKGLSVDLGGIPDVGKAAYCEAYNTFPVLRKEEYGTFLGTPNVSASIGLGTKVITSPDNLPGVTYSGTSACYNLSESFVGFAGSDVIGNANSSFNDQYDELPGPYTPTAQYDEVLESRYNRPYHVTLQMIQDHIDSVASGSSTYIPVWQILNWPAHGEVALGQALQVADFTDINANNVYEPMQGEYPAIYGTDCVFSVTHYRTNGNAGKALEFHSYVYTNTCDTSETFDNVLMRKVKVYSRGAEVDSIFYGGRFDGDLGNYNDDFFGTNVNLGMIYNYNGDLLDEDNAGRIGFHDTLAAQGLIVLKGFKQANDGLDNPVGVMPGESVNGYGYNDGITDNEYRGLYSSVIYTGNAPAGQSDPTDDTQLYHVLGGYFQFGDIMYYGGTGFAGGAGVTTIQTKYMYSGGEDLLHFGTEGIDPGFDWYEFAPSGTGSNANPAGDRRGGYSFGQTALSNGDFFELDYAYLIQRQAAPAATIFDPAVDLFAKAVAVRSAFLSNDGPCGINFDPVPVDLGIEESTFNEDVFTVYPNPTTGLISINGVSENGATIEVFDINGKLLYSQGNYQTTQTIDLSGWDGSLFIVRITDGSKSARKRVVKH